MSSNFKKAEILIECDAEKTNTYIRSATSEIFGNNNITIRYSTSNNNGGDLDLYTNKQDGPSTKFSRLIIDNLSPNFSPIQTSFFFKMYDNNFQSSKYILINNLVTNTGTGGSLTMEKNGSKTTLYFNNIILSPGNTNYTKLGQFYRANKAKVNDRPPIPNDGKYIMGKIVILYTE
jgi:hypothetical protein